MYRRRKQTMRFGTRAVRAAGRTVAKVAKGVYRAARRYKPSYGMRTAAKTAAAAAAYPLVYKPVRKAISKSIGTYNGGNDWTVSKKTIGRSKKPTVRRLNRLIEVGMSTNVYRFQNITNFDTNVGALALPNWSFTTGQIQMPFHIYDLTSFNNNSIDVVNPGYYYQWASNLVTADIVRAVLPGQTATGGADATGVWQVEERAGSTTFLPNAKVMRHNWTDIRINFYGPRKRTTWFELIFFRVKDEFMNPTAAAVTNNQLKELMLYLERPSIYSNLQRLETDVWKRIKIVKRMKYWVSAAQTTDVDTSVGKIKEARVFMKHDKIYKLDWRHQGVPEIPHDVADGLDFLSDSTHHNSPWYGSRLYMMVRAFAPERIAGKTAYPSAADANVDPSYDIIIRNSVSVPA